MTPPKVCTIALWPTGNDQGGYYFFSLKTGRLINQNRWAVILISNKTISPVHQLACRDPLGIDVQGRRGSESLHDSQQIRMHRNQKRTTTAQLIYCLKKTSHTETR
eukprot:10280710-Ditylum_brightwellii.AAC.1